MPFCPACGFEHPTEARFCPHCGQAITTLPVPSAPAVDPLPLPPTEHWAAPRLVTTPRSSGRTAGQTVGIVIGVLFLATFVGCAALVGLTMAVGPKSSSPTSASTQPRPPAAPATAARTVPATATPFVISEDAQEHYNNALDFHSEGNFGLALVEIDQAVAAQPDWTGAVDRRLSIRIEATRAVEQAQAQATAQVVAAATERAQAALAARLANYANAAPKGGWGTSLGGVAVSVGDFSYFTRASFRTAASGWRYVAFGIRVANRTSGNIHVNPNNVTLVDQKGGSYRYDSTTFSWCNTPLQGVDIRPGNNADGCLVFYLPANTGPAKILYRTALFGGQDVVVNIERDPDFD